MNLQATFRIHIADPLGLVDTPFIVTTAYTLTSGQSQAEWFLVVPEGKGILFAQRNTLDCKNLPDTHVKFDEELLLNEVLDQATLRLRRYILEHKGDSAPLLLARQTELQHTDHEHLAKLWLRGSYCGCLSEIRAKSKCTALIDTLVWIHGLPMLATQEL
jgi:hypothetical protein